MNITIFIGSTYGGGAERVCCNLANYLANKGHRVKLLTMAETEKTYELNDNITLTTLLPIQKRNNLYHRTIGRINGLIKYLIKEKEENAYIVMLPKTIDLLIKFRGLTDAKIIISERGNPEAYNSKTQYRMKRCALKCDGYVFQTKDAFEWYKKYVDGKKIAIIPNAINPEFIGNNNCEIRKKEIIAVGRLSTQKNFELLINAFIAIAADFPLFSLVIYGEGSERERLQYLIDKSGLSERIILAGNVSDMAKHYSEAYAYVLSSNYEGMPNALIEAMASGLPCIATDCPVGGPRYLIQNGQNGVLIPVGSENDLINALKMIMSNEKFARQIGRKAEKIQDELSPSSVYSKWEMYISSIVNKGE